MNLTDFYNKRISCFHEKEIACLKKDKTFPVLRLLSLCMAGVSLFFLMNINLFAAIAIALVFVILFMMIAKKDIKNSFLKNKYQVLKQLNENELNTLLGNYDFFDDGNQYKNSTHTYTHDLDIFGNSSLFHCLNRTTLEKSSDILADWLLQPADGAEIKTRNEAVMELCEKIDWRQNIFFLGFSLNQKTKNATRNLLNWMQKSTQLFFPEYVFFIIRILPFLTLGAWILSFYILPISIAVVLTFLHFVIIFFTNTKIKICHQEVTRNAGILKSYSEIIKEIESANFTSLKLIQLKNLLKTKGLSASEHLRKLSQIVTNLDCRYNIYVHIFLNTFLFWDIRQVHKLAKWKKTNSNLAQWFQSVGEFEALSSFANLRFNNPDWCFPKINESGFVLDAKKLGHPLIVNSERVCNDFTINGNKIIILTGSNMSGKSTFLRTIGVNHILALAGSCVCAESYIFSPYSIISTMRISDSLKDSTSSFYAELKKIETIVKRVDSKEKVFLLLDEILRGTNSMDRHTGSKALIVQLIQNKAVGIIATHDIALTELINEFPENIENYNFDIKIQNEELFFDYKLNQGVCTSFNASILMKKMGINIT